ncbi:hypothetical protein DZF98_12995 [Clavibacter californiensis]|uniref:Transposase IS701-like DDE domain-containing protein n=1 Tax=Clavibacter californiensis TaxID=1401995 RepID=A0ABX9N6Z7_9MICO|nr:hypothetical protein DZF98_12995 [Clavibacter californiensis]
MLFDGYGASSAAWSKGAMAGALVDAVDASAAVAAVTPVPVSSRPRIAVDDSSVAIRARGRRNGVGMIVPLVGSGRPCGLRHRTDHA